MNNFRYLNTSFYDTTGTILFKLGTMNSLVKDFKFEEYEEAKSALYAPLLGHRIGKNKNTRADFSQT